MKDLMELANKIRDAEPSDQLRVAADLLDEAKRSRKPINARMALLRIARAITGNVSAEIDAALLHFKPLGPE